MASLHDGSCHPKSARADSFWRPIDRRHHGEYRAEHAVLHISIRRPGYCTPAFSSTRCEHRCQSSVHHDVSPNWNRLGSQHGESAPIPGLAKHSRYISTRTTGSASLRSVFSKTLVNVFTAGWQNQDTYNYPFVTSDQFENQGGFNLSFPTIGGVALRVPRQARVGSIGMRRSEASTMPRRGSTARTA